MIVYLAIQGGIYRHRVLGVFQVKADAIRAGTEFIEKERDHYHVVEIVEMTLNDSSPDAERMIHELRWVWASGKSFGNPGDPGEVVCLQAEGFRSRRVTPW